MKIKISIICLLLIFVYCLSAVCAADLNQTIDDVKTDDKEDSLVLVDDDVNTSDEKCIPVTAEDEGNQVTDAGEVVSENDTVAPIEKINSFSLVDGNNDTVAPIEIINSFSLVDGNNDTVGPENVTQSNPVSSESGPGFSLFNVLGIIYPYNWLFSLAFMNH